MFHKQHKTKTSAKKILKMVSQSICIFVRNLNQFVKTEATITWYSFPTSKLLC